ncbi:MAG TPA: DUF2220 family protein [Myxococcota bacterium]|nr:DUF2220 family protein [Myxococcota bacterium]
MWSRAASKLALLELLTRRTLRRRQTQDDAFRELAALPWTQRTSRRDELVLVPQREADLRALLDRVWPEWPGVWQAMQSLGLEPSPTGFAAYEDQLRAANAPSVPTRVNRKTAAALVAPHSKAALTRRRLSALGEVEATSDGIVRMRPPVELRARNALGEVDLSAVAAVLGEVALPERSFEGLTFEGPVRAILTVENLGAFVDVSVPQRWLVAYVAGWDTATVGRLFAVLPGVPALHFGDLDPAGVRIYRHLREVSPGLQWFVPDFASALVDRHGLPLAWPDDLDLSDEGTPELVRELARRGLWLEQEVLAIDPRIQSALEGWLAS